MSKTQKRLGIGIIITNQNGEYLLHLRDVKAATMTNQWSIVGGGVNKNETPEDAAIREVWEETNLKIEKLTFLKKINFSDKWDAVIFTANINTKNQKLQLNEGRDLKFFKKEELKILFDNLKYTNPFLDAIKDYIN